MSTYDAYYSSCYGYPYVNYYSRGICSPCAPACVPACAPACPAPVPPTSVPVAYYTGVSAGTTIPSNPVGTAPSPPAPGSTVIAGVTPILNFSTPSFSTGNITVNAPTGQFNIPTPGRYYITSTIGYPANSVGDRQSYIYKIDGTTNILYLLAVDTKNALVTGPTYLSLATSDNLNAGDKIFFAGTQNSGSSLTTLVDFSRFSITKACC